MWQDKIRNTEVLRYADTTCFFAKIKQIQLCWNEYVVRTPDCRLLKSIFYSELANARRNYGAPHKRFKDARKPPCRS
uniref:Uncharacterized protein n=1 Tax=Octopus bimaculoides TaxID=37653 RepID=A0A0L8GB22_OCTBM